MSRLIKFRAWREKQKFMLEPHSLVDLFTYGHLVNPDEVVWMQFTGLTDKNGVEIYEGDVINYGGENHSVEMCGPSWSFPEFVGSDYYGHDEPELQDWSEFEVIGNIHQHPELIK